MGRKGVSRCWWFNVNVQSHLGTLCVGMLSLDDLISPTEHRPLLFSKVAIQSGLKLCSGVVLPRVRFMSHKSDGQGSFSPMCADNEG